MSGEVSISLARKWRPRRFADLVGHEYAARALQNAVSQNRLHHAFLFTGTRGVGKTTMARLLALLFNCKNQTEKEPCLECESCSAIIAGLLSDVIEVDAASHTKVEETRELLEGAVYVPAIGKFKVFIIDEVHMLSKNSFNAMLKTLEEPPPHVKFILATTNPEKMPATVLSRCLCFSLSPLPKQLIVGRLQDILTAEAVKFEEAAVSEIARLARGSLRDALSIADQAIAHCDLLLRAEDVRRLVGDIDLSALADILRALSKADTPAVAAVAAKLAAENTGFDTALARLAALIYKAALFAAVPDAATDNPEEAIVGKKRPVWFSPEELQALYEIALRGRRQLPYAPDEQTGFEMTLLRMTLFAPQSAAESSSAAAPAAVPVAKPPATIPEAPPISKSEELPAAAKDWPSVTAQLNETALALVRNCTLRSFDGKGVILVLDESRLNGSEHLFGHLKSELARICGKSFKLELLEGKDNAAQEARQKAAEAEAMKVPFVRDFLAAMPESRLIVDNSSKPDGV
ncbi:MAG: DNA polymerase III subunit gamma/tau [Candidatus Zeuxoniibacter abyssi]|nr:MAG: DNA polymerase III subunit gamma/tau [Candidatus Persebacteraceae bacterium AB1(2)]